VIGYLLSVFEYPSIKIAGQSSFKKSIGYVTGNSICHNQLANIHLKICYVEKNKTPYRFA